MSSKAIRLKMAEAVERSRATKSVDALRRIIEEMAAQFIDKRLRLTQEQKEAIANSKLTVPELADAYKVSPPTIRTIIRKSKQLEASPSPKRRRR